MNSQEIEKILERYFNGETSRDEELALNAFFSKKDVPAHLKSLKPMFNYLDEASQEELDEDFDERFFSNISKKENTKKRSVCKLYLYVSTGVAASILVILGLFYQFDVFSSKMEDTFSDPAVAYNEARKALLFVSYKFNSGLEPAKQLASFDNTMKKINKVSGFGEGVENMEKVSAYQKGLEELSKFSKYYKTETN
ncbi:MAG: hypothetical protein K9G67_15945 [Bacteroidales bacterium]|nr:hypothetical protein [Bacteroidales bacterium]MCF8343755.1 hypothetical protein [Bacteroidales bacterium]MCF8377848.1 hypothetical protein [Bacteroidales bacterium]